MTSFSLVYYAHDYTRGNHIGGSKGFDANNATVIPYHAAALSIGVCSCLRTTNLGPGKAISLLKVDIDDVWQINVPGGVMGIDGAEGDAELPLSYSKCV